MAISAKERSEPGLKTVLNCFVSSPTLKNLKKHSDAAAAHSMHPSKNCEDS